MDDLEPPHSFSFERNVSQGWKLWLKHFKFYLTATEKDGKNDKVKTSVLLTCIGRWWKETCFCVREVRKFRKYISQRVKLSRVKLSAYNGSKIPVVGKCSLTLDHKNNYFKVSFIVVDLCSVPILGLKTSERLQLIKRICRIEANRETFFSEYHNLFGK